MKKIAKVEYLEKENEQLRESIEYLVAKQEGYKKTMRWWGLFFLISVVFQIYIILVF